MPQARSSFSVAIGAAVGGLVSGQVAGAASQAASTQEVKVVNATTEPVPTDAQGTTRVAGTVRTLPAGQAVQFEARVCYPPDTDPIYVYPALVADHDCLPCL